MNPPWLTQEEVDDLCAPLTQACAQIRYMASLGLNVKTKPNGAPLVIRSHFEAVMNPQAKGTKADKPQPNRAKLIASFERA